MKTKDNGVRLFGVSLHTKPSEKKEMATADSMQKTVRWKLTNARPKKKKKKKNGATL